MGLRSRFQIRMKQAAKRKKKRAKLTSKGRNPAEFFYGKFYLKTGTQQ